MAASLVTADEDIVILKAGWVYRQKPLFKKWKKSWLVITLGGNLRYFTSKRSSSAQQTYNVKHELMLIKVGAQCRTLLPPPDIDTGCLFELFFTGDRKVSLCAHDLASAELWMQAIARAQSDKNLPTPRYSRKNRTKEDELKEDSVKQNLRQEKTWFKLLCCGGSNQVQTFTTPRRPMSRPGSPRTRPSSSWT